MLAVVPTGASCVAPTTHELIAAAASARSRGDKVDYLAKALALHARMPEHPSLKFGLARAYALNGRPAQALRALRELADDGFGFPMDDLGLASLRASREFVAISKSMTLNLRPTKVLSPFAPLVARTEQPEGIVAVRGELLVGTSGSGRIIRIDAVGGRRSQQVLGAGWGFLGLRGDAEAASVYACANHEASGSSKIVRLRLRDLAVIKEYVFPVRGVLCNDLAVTPSGDVFATDSSGHRLWRLHGGRLLEVLIDRDLYYPNGIAYDARRARLLVADASRILSVDPATGRSAPLLRGSSTAGIDGMVVDGDRLIAMQNTTPPSRIVSIALTPGLRRAVTPLAVGEPLLQGSTTLAVSRGQAFVLSQTGVGGSTPDEPIVLQLRLGRR